MGMFTAINTASSGLSANRLQLDVISDNIANVNTTRTPSGDAYKRSRVIFAPRVDQQYWNTPFLPKTLDNNLGKGVRVVEIAEEQGEDSVRLVYDPNHPDAIKTGPHTDYVAYPNINVVSEMVDMISATRAYEANVSVLEGSKSMFRKAMDIGR